MYTGGRQEDKLALDVEVALTRKDEYGRILTPKEAFRQLCYRCAASSRSQLRCPGGAPCSSLPLALTRMLTAALHVWRCSHAHGMLCYAAPRHALPLPRSFHGIQPSKNTRERRAKKAAEEIAKKRLASEEGATSNAASLAQMKQASGAATGHPTAIGPHPWHLQHCEVDS